MDFHKYIKPIIFVFIGLIALWIGSSLFTYFTYRVEPQVSIVGIESSGYYKGIVTCSLVGTSGYKVASISLLIDGEPVNVKGAKAIGQKNFELPFEIDTREMVDGKHVLQLEAIDSSYNVNKMHIQFDFFVDNTPLKAAFLEADYRVGQGHTFHPKIQVNKPVQSMAVKIFSGDYFFYPEDTESTVYESFIPVDCEVHPGEYLMNVEVKDNVGNSVKLSSTVQVKLVEFPRQRGFHVEPDKLNEEREVSINNKVLNEALDKWLASSPKEKMWRGAFEVPTVVKRLSTPYGEIRVTPERGRYLHRAVDIVNDPRSVVWASQDGRVIIKDRYLMSGNTIVVDHGLGVFTKYFHLEDFADIEVGDRVRKGEPLGKVGMTGYANGYHLHWELSVNGVSVEPFEWTKAVY